MITQWIATQGGAEAIDNCSGVAWTSNYGSSPSGCLGDQGNLITFYATDSCGNVDSTSAYLSINDNTAPVILTIATDTTVICDGLGNVTEFQAWIGINGGGQHRMIVEGRCGVMKCW